MDGVCAPAGESIDADVPASETVEDLGAAYRVGVLRDAASAVLHAAFTESLVLVVEDAMWMDEASAQVLARAFHGIEHRPWFVCLTTRDRSQGLSAHLGFESRVLELAPLDGRLAEHLGSVKKLNKEDRTKLERETRKELNAEIADTEAYIDRKSVV